MKVRKILSLVFNLLAVGASIAGFLIIGQSLKFISFVKFFTLVTNLMIIIVGMVSIGCDIDALIKKDEDYAVNNFTFVLKLITAVCSMITFLTVVSYLQYTVYNGIAFTDPLMINNICHHYASTLLFTLGFVLFDLDKKYPFKLSFFGIIVLLIYMAYAIPFSNIEVCQSWWEGAPYVFMDYKNVGIWIVALLPGFIIGGLAISLLLWLINRIAYLIVIGDEVKKEEEETEEEKELESKVEVTPEDEEAVAKQITQKSNGPRIYHISKREDKMWQVKFATGKKAIKLFNTQAEAIVFAKKLAKSQDGSIRVHSLKGRIRKAN